MRPPFRLHGRPSLWLLLGLAPLAAARWYAGVSAAPAQDVPTCAWQRLDGAEDRSQHVLGYLPISKQIILYGGADLRQGAGSQIKDDTWVLPLGEGQTRQWRQLTVQGNPDDRMEHAAAVVRTIDTEGLATYGGIDKLPTGGGGTFTWHSPLLAGGQADTSVAGAYAPERVTSQAHFIEVQGASAQWTNLGPAGQARTDHSLIYSPGDSALIAFGGRRTEDANSADNSTSQLQLSGSPAWAPINASGAPSKRFAHTAVYDPVGVRMIVFGGTLDWDSGMNDVWALNLVDGIGQAAWERLMASGSAPRGRYDHAAAFIPGLDWMVVFGGQSDPQTQLSDVFALDLSVDPPVWRKLNPTGTNPPQLSGLAAAYSEVDNMVIFQGGQVGADARDQTWALVCGVPNPTATPTHTATSETPATPTEPSPGPSNTPGASNTPGPSHTPTEAGPSATPTEAATVATPTTPATPTHKLYLPIGYKHFP